MAEGTFIPGFSNKYNSQQGIDKIMKSKRVKLEKMEENKEQLIEDKKLLNEIKAKVISVRNAAKTLYGFDAPFDDKISMSSDEYAFTAKVNKNAEIGEYSVDIKEKARSHKIASSSLTKNHKIPAGDYLFIIGEDEVKIPFGGGTIDDFDDAVRRYGKNILKSTVTNNTSKTQVLILEGAQTGADNYIKFGNEKTKKVFMEMDFFEEVAGFEKRFKLDKNSLESISSPGKSPIFASDGVLFLDADDKYRLNLSENIPYKTKLIMEVDLRLEREKELTAEEKAKADLPPTGPDFKEFGKATIMDIELEAESQFIDIPPFQKKEEVEEAPPKIVEDDHYIDIVTNKRTLELDELEVTSEKRTLKFDLSKMLEPDEVIKEIIFKNNNTKKNLEAGNLLFYDEDTKGGVRYTKELSKPQDASLLLDGLEIVRSSNTIDDLLKGVTLNIFSETDGEESLQVDRDYEKIMGTIVEFLAEYNQLLDMVNEHTDNIPDDEGERGAFSSEHSLISLASKMRIIMMNAYETAYGQEIATLSQIGISTNASGGKDIEKIKTARGILEVDEERFIEMMEEYPDGIKQLFGNDINEDVIIDSGVAFEMERLLKSYTDNSTGYFVTKDKVYVDKLKGQDKDIEDYKKKLEDEERKLQKEFMKWERAADEMERNQKRFDNFNKK